MSDELEGGPRVSRRHFLELVQAIAAAGLYAELGPAISRLYGQALPAPPVPSPQEVSIQATEPSPQPTSAPTPAPQLPASPAPSSETALQTASSYVQAQIDQMVDTRNQLSGYLSSSTPGVALPNLSNFVQSGTPSINIG